VCDAMFSNIDKQELINEFNGFTEFKKQYACQTCYKVFSSLSSRSQHKKNCQATKPIPCKTEIYELIKTINELVVEVGNLKSQQFQKPTIINGNNNTIYNDNRIFINQYNKVDTNFIEKDTMKDILGKKTFHHLYDSLKEVISIVYYNEKHPENHAVFIPNIRERYARVFDGRGWVFKEKNDVITYMRNFGVELMRDYFYDNENEFNIIQKQLLTRWDKSYVDEFNMPFDRKTKEAVVETVLSRQKIVKETIDKYHLL
jgi:hypothetical protein